LKAPFKPQEFRDEYRENVERRPVSDDTVSEAALKLTINAPPPLRKARLDYMLSVRVGVFSDGPQHARVRKAAAQNTAEGDTDLLASEAPGFPSRTALVSGEDHAAQAKPTLRRTFLNKGLLDGMRFVRRA
jgi:hypothetical protein